MRVIDFLKRNSNLIFWKVPVAVLLTAMFCLTVIQRIEITSLRNDLAALQFSRTAVRREHLQDMNSRMLFIEQQLILLRADYLKHLDWGSKQTDLVNTRLDRINVILLEVKRKVEEQRGWWQRGRKQQ